MASLFTLLARRIPPLVLAGVLFSGHAFAQTGSSVLPNVVNGLDANGGQKLSPVGSGATGAVPMPVAPVPSGGSASGIAPSVAGSSASNTIVKAAAGNLYGAYVTTGATSGWLMVFNAVSKPADGATTAGIASGNLQECIVAPANTTTSISYIGAPPEVFTTGITLVFSSTACSSLTASATAYLHGSAF